MNIYLYILAMALTTYLIRVLPMTIFRKPIRSRFLRSFLYYVPYCCLTAMTFPSILSSTASILSGAAALVVERELAVDCPQILVQESDRGRLKQQRRGAGRGMGNEPFVK